jgi:hypothetical protein
MQLRTNSTAGNGLDNNYGSSCGDNVRWSIDSGSSFSDLYTLCHSLKTYGDDGLRSLGSTGNDDSQNYFFVDKMLLTCNIDGGDAISLSGEFASDTWLDINSGLSCDTLYGTGYVCDSQHDETMSTNPNSLPSLPCKLNTGVTCVDSADCWHNSACDGARISYSGLCNGTNVIIKDYNYVDSCGGSGVIDSTSYESQTSCTVDGGFPGGWGCDVNGPIIERTNKVDVYNDICKAGLGVSCAFDNDCVTGTTCESGLCSYYSLSIYSKNVSENKVYKNSVINFDGSVSVGLDIKYACWVFDSVNDECYGNISQCNIYCNGADYIGSNWETHYVKSFNNG